MPRRSPRFPILILPLAALWLALPAPAPAQDDLPTASFTSAQADRGRTAYRRNCEDCHGAQLNDGEFGGAPLKGVSFREKWFDQTADVLFSYLSNAMPPDRPGRLPPGTYADMMAFILAQNGVQPGATELPADEDKLAEQMVR